MAGKAEAWRISRTRQGIIHEAAGEWLARLVVMHVLKERLADSLHDAAMGLAFHEKRIHDNAEIVHHWVSHHPRAAGFGIHLHLGNMAAVGKRGGGPFMDVRDVKPAGKARGKL